MNSSEAIKTAIEQFNIETIKELVSPENVNTSISVDDCQLNLDNLFCSGMFFHSDWHAM